ncbi:MAG: signal recognition particle-docking protein FtsY [Nitrososphaerota archaeon]|nr:signal recognition particle-docking protein FtsY [Nitrososphaerota archaeon]
MFERLRNALKGFETTVTTKTLGEDDVSSAASELEMNLLESEVALEAAEHIASSLKAKLIGQRVGRGEDTKKLIEKSLSETLLSMFGSAPAPDIEGGILKKAGEPYVILFLGINGTGKTTTIAKVSKMLEKAGHRVVLAAGDTYRAGAIEQLEIHSQRLGTKILKQNYGSDPAAVTRDAKSYAKQHRCDVVLVDTAGRMQTSKNLMEELAKIKRVSQPDLTIFVGDSLAGNDLVMQAREFMVGVGFDAIILTKTDADVKGGASISAVYATARPIIYLGTGQEYDDIQKFEADWLISKILD